jgi:hypothetical protein
MASLDELERLLAEATPGPWRWECDEDNGQEGSVWCAHYEDELPAVCGSHSKAWPMSAEDAEAIAALRNEAPRLLALVRAGDAMYKTLAATDNWETGMSAQVALATNVRITLDDDVRAALAAWKEAGGE